MAPMPLAVPLVALMIAATGCTRLLLDGAGVAEYGLIDGVIVAIFVLRRRCRLF